jgi:hypothetical protein
MGLGCLRDRRSREAPLAGFELPCDMDRTPTNEQGHCQVGGSMAEGTPELTSCHRVTNLLQNELEM